MGISSLYCESVWHVACKCGESACTNDAGHDLNKKQATEHFISEGWTQPTKGYLVCPECSGK